MTPVDDGDSGSSLKLDAQIPLTWVILAVQNPASGLCCVRECGFI
jgi:hypothetical protein